jgi:hypothetical protein
MISETQIKYFFEFENAAREEMHFVPLPQLGCREGQCGLVLGQPKLGQVAHGNRKTTAQKEGKLCCNKYSINVY